MKRLTGMMALLMAMAIPANAETSADEPVATATEVQEATEVAQSEHKTRIELPAWVKNIKFSGYGMLQYQGQDPEGIQAAPGPFHPRR